MSGYEQPMSGSIRIRNPKTLERWIHRGWYQRELDLGYTFGIGCGRFCNPPCECHKCRRQKGGSPLQKVIDKHYKPKE